MIINNIPEGRSLYLNVSDDDNDSPVEPDLFGEDPFHEADYELDSPDDAGFNGQYDTP
jgi:hypothetical protein